MKRLSKSFKGLLSLLLLGLPLVSQLVINADEVDADSSPSFLDDIDHEWADFDLEDDLLDEWDEVEDSDLETDVIQSEIAPADPDEDVMPATGIIIGGDARVYLEPDHQEVLAILPVNTNIQLLQNNGDWYQIGFEDQLGWVYQSNVQPTIQIAVVLNDDALFQKSAQADSESLFQVVGGTKILVEAQVEDWVRTTIDDEIGWIRLDDLIILEGRRPGIVINETNLHSEPHELSAVLSVLSLNQELMVIQRTRRVESGISWSQVSVRNEEMGMITGWIPTTELTYAHHVRHVATENEAVPLMRFTNTGYNSEKEIAVDSKVMVLAEADAWSYIKYINNGETFYGWIASELLIESLELPVPLTVAQESELVTLRHTAVTVVNNVAFRTGPGNSYEIIGRLPANTNVRITGRLGSWNRIVHNGETVWVARSSLRRTVQRAVIRGNRVPVHASARGTSNVLTHATRGTRVTVTQRTRLWALVRVNGRSGWVRTNQLRIANGRAPGRITGAVNLHERPNANSPRRRRLRTGQEVMMLQRTTGGSAATAGWTQVIVIDAADRSHIGWVRTNRVQLSGHRRRIGGASNITVRRGPGTGFAPIAREGRIPRNTTVTVIAEIGNWSRIRFNRNGRRHYGWVRNTRVQPIHTLHREIEISLRRLQGGRNGIGMSYVCLVTGRRISVNGNRRFFGASTIKLPTNMMIAEAVHQGRLSWNQRLTIQQSDWIGGSGVLQHRARVGQRFTIYELMRHSIVYSDNIAHRMLVRALIPEFRHESVGLDNSRMELTNAVFNRYLRGHQRPNSRMIFTPNQTTEFFRVLHRDRNRIPGYEIILNYMMNTSWNDRFITSRTNGHVAHTPAWTHPFQHDSGIFFTDNPYILVVYTEGTGGVPFLRQAANEIFRINRRFDH